MELYTVGHSTRSLDDLLDLLRAWRIDVLADVRTVPRSRRNPHFNTENLARVLPAHGIEYAWLPELGGLRKPSPQSTNTGWRNDAFRGYADYMQTAAFDEALARLLALANGRRLACMCAEAVPWRCHRSLIADALLARGHDVRHIVSATKADAHRVTPFARIDGECVTYPAML